MKKNVKRKLILYLLFMLIFISCNREYVCYCNSSIGTNPTTVNGTSKKKAKKNCYDLSYKAPTNDTVDVYECFLK